MNSSNIIKQHVNVWSPWQKSNPFATHLCHLAYTPCCNTWRLPSLMCACNTTATCLISAWGKHASVSLPLGTNTHTYRLVMIFSDGEPSFTCSTSSSTRTNDVSHLVSTRHHIDTACAAQRIITAKFVLQGCLWTYMWAYDVIWLILTGEQHSTAPIFMCVMERSCPADLDQFFTSIIAPAFYICEHEWERYVVCAHTCDPEWM